MKEDTTQPRAIFATRLGAIATTVGSAVGLGNIWRFPYEAGSHGGGAFMLLYIGFIIVLGIPVLSAEFAFGRATRRGVGGAFAKLRPGSAWRHFGYIGLLAGIMILSFYSVVAGWTMEYCGGAAMALFDSGEGASMQHDFAEFTTGWRPVLWTVIFLAVNFLIIARGVQKGIERISNLLMPMLFLLIVAFCINSLTLPGAADGLDFLFHPDFSKLTPDIVISALGQAFFSLSLGLGTMMTYASYFSERTAVMRSAVTTAGLDTAIAILAGILIFPAVFSYGFEPAQGPRLVFEVLPEVFARMTGGRIWAVLFFFMLFLASLTSTISMCEIIVSFLTEQRQMKRSVASAVTIGAAMVLGILCALSFSSFRNIEMPWGGSLDPFGWFDYGSSNILLPLGGMLISIFAGWVVDRDVMIGALTAGGRGSRRMAECILFALRWIAPPMIALIFIVNL